MTRSDYFKGEKKGRVKKAISMLFYIIKRGIEDGAAHETF